MNLGQIYQSVGVWNKLTAIAMKPIIAYKILQYTKKINADFENAEKQRVALIHKLTGTKDGEDAKIDPNASEFVEGINAIMTVESDLEKLDMSLEEVIGTITGDLTVQDLALLEPFFKS